MKAVVELGRVEVGVVAPDGKASSGKLDSRGDACGRFGGKLCSTTSFTESLNEAISAMLIS